MARRLAEEEGQRVWERLERRLTAFDGNPEPAPRRTDVYEWDYGAFPGGFPARLLVRSGLLPDEALLSGIKEGMRRLGELALYFTAREYATGDDENGLDWEISLGELTVETLNSVGRGLECYLYSATDAWAIYFHHEGFAYCGGVPAFIAALLEHCEPLDWDTFPDSLWQT